MSWVRGAGWEYPNDDAVHSAAANDMIPEVAFIDTQKIKRACNGLRQRLQ